MGDNKNHAIVFGASGIIGWAIVNQLLSAYPTEGAFSKVTAITNRPLPLSDAHWPESGSGRPELQLVSGINLRRGDAAELADSLKQAVDGVESVTHVYYLVFTAVEDDIAEVATNLGMFQNTIDALNVVSPRLQFVTFPGGTRGYGIYVPGGTFTPPLTEDMVDNLPTEYAKTVVYPFYRELLKTRSEGRKWTWCEVCPDAIIGFTPNGSQYSLALHWAQYLSLYAYNHSVGPHTTKANKESVQVLFPGSSAGGDALFTPVSSQTIARFMIYASLHPESCGGGKLFNIADNETPVNYGDLWPRLAAWFGLVGTGPVQTSHESDNLLKVGELPQTTISLAPGDYIKKYRHVFAQCRRKNAVNGGVGVGNEQLDSVGYWLTFDRQLSLSRARETGFEVDQDSLQGWFYSFEMFRKAELIL